MSSDRATAELKGFATSRGVAYGPVFLYHGEGELSIPEYVVPLGGEPAELARFREGLQAARQDVADIVARLGKSPERVDTGVFESQLMMLDDPLLSTESERGIAVGRLNAAAAVRQVADRYRARFSQMDDPYFRERVRDLDDVERRILKHIAGEEIVSAIEISQPCVFVADDLSPSEVVRLPTDRILAIVLEGGSPTSHVSLLARSLGIPAVTGVASVTASVEAGEKIIVNGTLGTVTRNPDKAQIAAFRRASLRSAKSSTLGGLGLLADGSDILLFANSHPGLPTEAIVRSGATGIGLYRSEYLWLDADREPTEEEQFEAYRTATEFAKSLSPKGTLTLRTLDIGGDKIVRGLSVSETNPFLGNRSIRYLLSHPETFRTQLRAILRASAFGKICILHPMITCVDELTAAAELLADCRAELDREGVAYDKMIPVGAMIEVPAAALNAAALARHVDFFSVGTNDLVQYTLAADRGNESVAHLYQPTHPAVLELMRRTFDAAKSNDIPISVCGESAGDPVLGALWVAMGADLLSVSAGYVQPLARVLRRLSRTDLDAYAAEAASVDPQMSGPALYAKFKTWLQARIPDWDKLVC